MPGSTISNHSAPKKGSATGAVSSTRAEPTTSGPESARAQGYNVFLVIGVAVVAIVAVAALLFTLTRPAETEVEADYGPAGILSPSAFEEKTKNAGGPGKSKRGAGTRSPLLDCWDSAVFGRDYNGAVKQTKSGYPCRQWSQPSSRNHGFFLGLFWEPSLFHTGSCANPLWQLGIDTIFCMTNLRSPHPAWEECDVPVCKQIRINPCDSNPCFHWTSKCINDQYRGFICKCGMVHTGVTCTEWKLACASNPCQYGGTCEEFPTPFFNYVCRCVGNRVGRQCEILPTEKPLGFQKDLNKARGFFPG